jgi:hypothetical protein
MSSVTRMPDGQQAAAAAAVDPGLGPDDLPPGLPDRVLGLADRVPPTGLPEPAPAARPPSWAGRIPHPATTAAIAPTATPRHSAAAALRAVKWMLCILRSISWRHFAVNRGCFGSRDPFLWPEINQPETSLRR